MDEMLKRPHRPGTVELGKGGEAGGKETVRRWGGPWAEGGLVSPGHVATLFCLVSES